MRIEKANQGKEWRFYRDDNKYYTFDYDKFKRQNYSEPFNCFLGLRQQPLKNPPNTHYLECGLLCYLKSHYHISKTKIQLIDSLLSFEFQDIRHLDMLPSLTDAEIKNLLRFISKNLNQIDKRRFSVQDAYYEYLKDRVSTNTDFRLLPEREQDRLLRNELDCLTDTFLSLYRRNRDLFKCILEAQAYGEMSSVGREMIKAYYRLAQRCNAPINPKANLIKEIPYLQALYREHKEQGIKKTQTLYDIAYSNNKFQVVVPTTLKELTKEGTRMNNCISDHELEHFILPKERMVGFVRPIGSDKSLADFDISLKSGRICQFLGNSNSDIDDPDLLEFKEEYQQYLTEKVFN